MKKEELIAKLIARFSHAVNTATTAGRLELAEQDFAAELSSALDRYAESAVTAERNAIADWLSDPQAQFPQIAGWETTFAAFQRAAAVIRSQTLLKAKTLTNQ